ncbi:hypothetical protein LG293_16200 (plasmid) [Citricoccus nitrophenolicus]
MTENMAATIIASMAVIGAASGALMLAQISVAFDQGVVQRQASANAVNAAVATHRTSPLTTAGKTVTQDGVKVKVWSSTASGQTIYHGKPVKCLGPGCREYVTPLPAVGQVAVGAMDSEYPVTRHDKSMTFTLPAGKDRFYFAMEGVKTKDVIAWKGTEKVASGVEPKRYSFTSGDCLTDGCSPVGDGSVFGVIDLGEKTVRATDFTIYLKDPTVDYYALPASDNIIIYTLPEGA